MKKGIFTILTALLSLTLTMTVTGCKKGGGAKVVVKGSTTVLPITQKAAEIFYQEKKISVSVSGSGSGNGIKSIIDGSCDIANSSREMKEKEHSLAEKKGIEVIEVSVALDMIVPVVHPDNPVKNITSDQLKAIYTGAITNWKELGGKDETIVVVSRDTSSGTYEVWEEKIMKNADVFPGALLQASNGAIASTISKNRKAIGYVGYGYLNRNLKPLTVNKIPANLTNGKSGKYPVSRKLYMYLDKNRISPETQKFVDFLLSAEGQKLVKETGFLPL